MIVDPILGLFFFLALSTAHFCQVLGLEMTTRRLVVSCWRIMLVVWRNNGEMTHVMEDSEGERRLLERVWEVIRIEEIFCCRSILRGKLEGDRG